MNKRAVVARDGLADLVQEMLVELGEDIGREGLKRTPERVAASLPGRAARVRDIAVLYSDLRYGPGRPPAEVARLKRLIAAFQP